MIKWLAILLLFVASLAGCDREKKQRQEIIEHGVALQVEQFRQRQEAICKQQAIERAIVIADSIMRTEGPKTSTRIGVKPPPAQKPVMPPLKKLPDSLSHDALKKD